jgi:putative DNA primase/helicase
MRDPDDLPTLLNHGDALVAPTDGTQSGQQAGGGTPIDALLDSVEESLAPNYRLDRERHVIVRGTGERATPICGPIHAEALVQSSAGRPSLLRLRLLNDAGTIDTIDIPNADLAASTPQGVAMLRDAGLHMPASAREMAALLRSFRPRMIQDVAATPGWDSRGLPAFGLRDGRIVIAQDAKPVDSPSPLFRPDQQLLDTWKSDIAALASGNPFVLFSLCHGLAGPLMRLADASCFGVNLAAETSSGKTTVARMLAGLWPNLQLEDWEATDAAREDLCYAARDGLLILDEMPLENRKLVSDTIMRIMNGRPRGVRRERQQSAASTRPDDWRLSVFSTSEKSVRATVSARGAEPRGGVLVRMLDLAPDNIWPEIHGFRSRHDMLRHLDARLRRCNGIAGPSFVAAILKGQENLHAQLPIIHEKNWSGLARHLHINLDTTEGATARVLNAIALISTAGQIAARYGILPQSPREIRQAVTHVTRDCLAGSHGASSSGPDAHAIALENLRSWLGTHAQTRLVELDADGRPIGRPRAAAGWRSDSAYFLPPETLSLATRIDERKPLTTFLQRLAADGLLIPGGQRNSLQVRMGSAIHGRPFVYQLDQARLAAFGAQEDADASEDG